MFCAAGDLKGQALRLNTMVTGYYYEWANFAPLDRWLPSSTGLLGRRRSRSSIGEANCARARRR
jgi:hypothetical protein